MYRIWLYVQPGTQEFCIPHPSVHSISEGVHRVISNRMNQMCLVINEVRCLVSSVGTEEFK